MIYNIGFRAMDHYERVNDKGHDWEMEKGAKYEDGRYIYFDNYKIEDVAYVYVTCKTCGLLAEYFTDDNSYITCYSVKGDTRMCKDRLMADILT